TMFRARLGARLHNLYGPTEVSIDATHWKCEREVEARAPIGRPLSNAQTYVLTARMQPVPLIAPGELHVGGVGLGRGYLGRPGLTGEKFIPDPFSPEPGGRLYKTGDLTRLLSNGEIEYLGRIDHQVKIRGFRIELGEIEAAVRRNAHVEDVVVVAREEDKADKRLIGYGGCVKGERIPGGDELGLLGAEQLPGYML